MPFTARGLAHGPALGDFVDRVRGERRFIVGASAILLATFLLVAFLAPLVGLLLLASLLMVGVATAAYSRRELHGHGRLVHGPRHRR